MLKRFSIKKGWVDTKFFVFLEENFINSSFKNEKCKKCEKYFEYNSELKIFDCFHYFHSECDAPKDDFIDISKDKCYLCEKEKEE